MLDCHSLAGLLTNTKDLHVFAPTRAEVYWHPIKRSLVNISEHHSSVRVGPTVFATLIYRQLRPTPPEPPKPPKLAVAMSLEKPSHMQHRSHKPTPKPLNESDISRNLNLLNAQLEHLCDKILPPYPYLVSVPSDVPYRHSSRFVNRWYLGTPFAREEEQLQYMSFLPHQEEESSLLKAEGGWSDESGNMISEDVSPRVTYISGANTPLSSAQRKKISLNDYKNKGKSGNEGSESSATKAQEPERDLGMQAKKIDVVPPLAQEITDEVPKTPEAPESPRRKKRSHDELIDFKPQAHPKGLPSPSEKETQVVSPRGQERDGEVIDPAPKAPQEVKTVPALLSPTLPPKEKAPDIPRLISPTLPPSIEAFLANETEKHQIDGSSDPPRADPVRSILAAAGLDSSPHPALKRSPAVKAEEVASRVRSDSQLSGRSIHSAVAGSEIKVNGKLFSPALKPSFREESRALTPKANGVRSSPGPRQRHTIILKYGKRNRKRVEALLKLASRGKKTVPKAIPEQHSRSEQSPGRPESNAGFSQHHKRVLSDISPEPSTKRQKLPHSAQSLSERPQTPIASGLKSPQIQGSLQPRSAFSTPKKDLKSSAMRRVESAEGIEVRTPTGGPTRHSTPMSTERSSLGVRSSPPPTSAPSSRDEERRAWHAFHQKYFELGRTIKKDSSTFGPSPTSDPTNKELAMSVVLLTEGLLCFMINLTALSNVHPGPDPGWRTILPYHIFVVRASRKFPHLHGLVVQLGAVCRQVIHKFDMDRLARDPLPDEQAASAPTPGSDGNTKVNEDVEKYKRRYLEFRNELVTNAKELQVAWLDGSRRLSLDVLEREYPQTWAERSKDSAHRGSEKVSPDKLGGDFFLPLDPSSTPFEAVRFVMSFLREWARREDVKWKPRVEI